MFFTNESFAVFQQPGLEERMGRIRHEIQPIFQHLGEPAIDRFTKETEMPFYLHIAQHRRRTINPPAETWAAISPEKRGYKMDAHFQMGINSEYVFFWLSVIDQPKNQQKIAENWLKHPEYFDRLPQDFVLSKDHTKPDYLPLVEWESLLNRLAKVKKSEFQIGKIFLKEDIDTLSIDKMLAIYQELLPLYQIRIQDK